MEILSSAASAVPGPGAILELLRLLAADVLEAVEARADLAWAPWKWRLLACLRSAFGERGLS